MVEPKQDGRKFDRVCACGPVKAVGDSSTRRSNTCCGLLLYNGEPRLVSVACIATVG